MKKILLFCCLIWQTNIFGQDSLSVPWRLVKLPVNTDIKSLNFGVVHRTDSIKKGEVAYIDTLLANAFFSILAESVEPKKVVLVTEDAVYERSIDQIQERDCIWITSKMKRLGFTKFVAADRRGSTSKLFMMHLHKVNDFAYKNYQANLIKGKTDYYGFGFYKFKSKPMADSTAEKIIPDLGALAENRNYEKNLLRICAMLSKKGYIPVVVAGRQHVLSLKRPCMIQVKNADKVNVVLDLQSEISLLDLCYFVLDDMTKRFNLVAKKTTTVTH